MMPRTLLLLTIATTCLFIRTTNAARQPMFEVESAAEFQREEEAILLLGLLEDEDEEEEETMRQRQQQTRAEAAAELDLESLVAVVDELDEEEAPSLNRESFLREEQEAESEAESQSEAAAQQATAEELPVENQQQQQQLQTRQSLLRATREAFQREEREAEAIVEDTSSLQQSRLLRVGNGKPPPTQQGQQEPNDQSHRRTTTYLENLNQKTHSVGVQSFYHTNAAPNRPLVETTGNRLNKVGLQMLFEEDMLDEMMEVVDVAQMSMTSR